MYVAEIPSEIKESIFLKEFSRFCEIVVMTIKEKYGLIISKVIKKIELIMNKINMTIRIR